MTISAGVIECISARKKYDRENTAACRNLALVRNGQFRNIPSGFSGELNIWRIILSKRANRQFFVEQLRLNKSYVWVTKKRNDYNWKFLSSPLEYLKLKNYQKSIYVKYVVINGMILLDNILVKLVKYRDLLLCTYSPSIKYYEIFVFIWDNKN